MDVAKGVKLKNALTVHSQKTRQNEIEKDRRDSGTTVRLKLNRAGDLRGMTNAGDSEKMKALRAMRKLWNAKMPLMQCSSCQFAQQCPMFRPGYECAYNRFFDSHVIESPEDLIFYAKELCTQGVKRAQKMLLAETLSGGTPSLETSEALSHVFAQVMQLHERVTSGDEVEIISDDSSLLAKLFGGLNGIMDATRHQMANPIEVPSFVEEAKLLSQSTVPEESGPEAELMRDLAVRTQAEKPAPVEEKLPV